MHFWFWYSIFSCFSKCLILNCFSSFIDFSLQSHMTHNCWSTINNIMSGQRNPHFVSIRESFFLNMFPLTIPFLIFATNYGFSPSTCLTHPLFYQIPSFPSFHSLYKITAHPPASKTVCVSLAPSHKDLHWCQLARPSGLAVPISISSLSGMFP